MTTLQNRPTRPHIFFGAVLFVLVLTASILAWQAVASIKATSQVEGASLKPEDQVTAEAAATNPTQLSAAAALATGQHTLFYFYPADICSMRYCRQAAMIASELAGLGYEGVNVVQITAHTIPLNAENDDSPQLPFENWDLYPVPPYSEWLPELTETSSGLGLVRPVMVLVDGSGDLLGQFDEFIDFTALKKYLDPPAYLDSPTSMA